MNRSVAAFPVMRAKTTVPARLPARCTHSTERRPAEAREDERINLGPKTPEHHSSARRSPRLALTPARGPADRHAAHAETKLTDLEE